MGHEIAVVLVLMFIVSMLSNFCTMVDTPTYVRSNSFCLVLKAIIPIFLNIQIGI
jgi:hypothetical protein